MEKEEPIVVAHESWKTTEDGKPRIKVVLSDLHLSAGMFWGGERNPHEDFYFDEELSNLIFHFCSGKYGGSYEVELILNGDIFDFLNVPYKGDFPETITEELAVWKLQKCLNGHSKVINALKHFLSFENKFLTYQVGNHDADIFFDKVREILAEELNPRGSNKIKFIYKEEFYTVDGNIQIHHGHQFEAVHVFNYKMPFLSKGLEKPILNIPWGSFFVMKIVNRLKRERDYLDKVRPIKLYLIYGMFTDTLFTLKYIALTALYFFKTRFVYDPRRRSTLKTTLKILKEEFRVWEDGENTGKELLRVNPDIQGVIMGHTHVPRFSVYADGRIYVNTGTWTKMVSLDLRSFGQSIKHPFCLIEYDGKGGRPQVSLQEWVGDRAHHQLIG